jgi:nucleoside 2-deoxyribosyltransferase
MKYFISYRHTGAEEPRLGNLQNAIKEAFDTRPQDEFYSTYYNQQEFDSSNMGAADIMRFAFKIIDTNDIMLVILDSETKSEGMLIEIGYCLAKNKKIIIAKNSNINNSYCQDLADYKFDYANLEDLKQKLITI